MPCFKAAKCFFHSYIIILSHFWSYNFTYANTKIIVKINVQISFFFLIKANAVSAQKNLRTETVLLSTQNIC